MPNKRFNSLRGDRRLLFYDEPNGRQIDVFVGQFLMCHQLDLDDRLSLDHAHAVAGRPPADQAPDRRAEPEGPARRADPATPARSRGRRRGSGRDRAWTAWSGSPPRLGLVHDVHRQPRRLPGSPTRSSPGGRTRRDARGSSTIVEAVETARSPSGGRRGPGWGGGPLVRAARGGAADQRVADTKIFFATDIHGSDLCFRKFLNAASFYGADVLVMGGDMTGKMLVPIVARGGEYEERPVRPPRGRSPRTSCRRSASRSPTPATTPTTPRRTRSSRFKATRRWSTSCSGTVMNATAERPGWNWPRSVWPAPASCV